MTGIYKITSPTGKIYIGQSTSIKKRFKCYKSSGCKYQVILHNSFEKHGIDNHTFEVVEICPIKALNERERYWQDYYNCVGGKIGMNCRATASNDKSGYFSNETKKRMSISAKKKIFTEQHLKKITEEIIKNNKKYIGVPKSQNHRDKISKTLTGRKNYFFRGFNHPRGEIVLDTMTGIYYGSIADCARYNSFNKGNLQDILKGKRGRKNNTKFLLV